ncbi:MAG: hypothetical protein KBC44_02965 [Candidatus Pacebacteria bacterium]|nr:hypothetical protein [Candidatus Paceibacterota bacterium]
MEKSPQHNIFNTKHLETSLVKKKNNSIPEKIWMQYQSNSQFPSNYFYDLNHQYKNLRKHLSAYLFDEKQSGLIKALKDKEYQNYYNNLQDLISKAVGEYIIVNRIEGYRGDGRGVGEYVSASYDYTWGRNPLKEGSSMKVYLVKKDDVVLAGTGGERELIIKRSGLVDITEQTKSLLSEHVPSS